MHFVKYQGLGNDFVFVDADHVRLTDPAAVARAVCDRRFGVGADGLILLSSDGENTARMRVINSDGSEAEMCGNASRCAPLFWRKLGRLQADTLLLQTLAGPVSAQVMDWQKGLVRVDMGAPRLLKGQIPMQGIPDESAQNISLQAAGTQWTGFGVSMGNPHFVIFVPDITQIDLPFVGPQIETHTLFPQKTNVEFVQILDEHTVRMRVWERGAGITAACGTGSCASVVAAQLAGYTTGEVKVILDGGELHITWNNAGPVYMTGPATQVFEGEYTQSYDAD